jgi:acyl-CoA reductase-like NAD-dependent aldehyde dehydrogenase
VRAHQQQTESLNFFYRSVRDRLTEMGGKSAAIVLEDIDEERMENLLDWIMFGIFIGNGQACSATSRLLLHKVRA